MQHIIPTILLLLLCCCNTKQQTEPKQGFLSIESSCFVDEQGREVILNGINHVNKNPEEGHINKDDEKLFPQFKKWGFNFIRYGINWAHLEPQPGVINEAYLKEIDKRVAWAQENNLWLMLDMHQDLYGIKYGNGAPLWACLDEELPHVKGDVWSDSYLISPAVQKAFDSFWENKPASDGIGIQDHYINCWTVIAKRYASSPSVAGFDVMNEPFMGSEATTVFPKLLEGYAMAAYQKDGTVLQEKELMRLFENEESRVEVLASLNDKQMYATLLTPAKNIVDNFEQGNLSRFYQKLRNAIRQHSKQQIIFLEHNYFCNLGIKSTFRIPINKDGTTDNLCAYAPHGYDLVTDTEGAANPGENRVAFIFEQIFKSAKERDLATVVGEWGAFYMGENIYYRPAKQLIELFEEHLAGQTYWAYWNKIETQDYFQKLLARTYPQFVNGKIKQYGNNFEDNSFQLEWTEDGKSELPTRIYINNLAQIKQISVLPKASYKQEQYPESQAGYIDIEAQKGNRRVTITF